MFPTPAGSSPDLAASAAAAKSTTKKEKNQAAMQPFKEAFANIAKAKAELPPLAGVLRAVRAVRPPPPLAG
eukprot:12090893-Alexandrium_andersonii.AAC.1